MISEYRIVESKSGYIVEVQEVKWSLFGLKVKWIPFITISGMEEAWHFQNRDIALNEMLYELKLNILSKGIRPCHSL
jgi:hypothetical protein